MNLGKNFALYFVGVALMSLAGALVFFTIELKNTGDLVDKILEKMAEKGLDLKPVISEVAKTRKLIPEILEEVKETRNQLPRIVEVTDKAINAVLVASEELKISRGHLPEIIAATDNVGKVVMVTTKEIEKSRKELPSIITATNKASEAVVLAAKEIKQTRPLIPEIIKEVEITRKSIPGYLDKMEDIVDEAKTIGKESGEGVVSGFLMGVVSAPFSLVGSLGSSIVDFFGDEAENLTEEDKKKMEKATDKVLAKNKVNYARSWENSETGRKGKATLVKIEKNGEKHCRTVKIEVFERDKLIVSKEMPLCKGESKAWSVETEK